MMYIVVVVYIHTYIRTETRIYKMMYIVLVDLQTIKLQSANPREFTRIRPLRPSNN